MAGDAQIGFNINNVPFGKHSISGPAKNTSLHVRIYRIWSWEAVGERRASGREHTDGLWKGFACLSTELVWDRTELHVPVRVGQQCGSRETSKLP